MFEGSSIDYLGPVILYAIVALSFSFFVMINEGRRKDWLNSDAWKSLVFLTFHSIPIIAVIFLFSLAIAATGLTILVTIGEIFALTYPLSMGMFELSKYERRENDQRFERLESEIRDLKNQMR
jgi:hypothetical protein